MCVIYVVEEHGQVLDLWRTQQAQSLHVLHMDAHCDMRGLLIDRRNQRAFRIWDKNKTVDQGNFLTYAILEGRVSSLRWVYSDLGGRQNDVGTVKYESDITATPYRWLQALRGDPGIPIHYESLLDVSWTDLMEDEYLDIDWDFFASIIYPEDTIQARVDAFLKKEFHVIPGQIYVCYSPGFSHPSRNQFRRFITDLSNLFNAKIVELQPSQDLATRQPSIIKYMPTPFFRVIRQIYYKTCLSLRKWGIY
jgi:hypothetical protein